METTTIKEIAVLKDDIRELLKTVDKSNYASTYGSENEYSGKGIYLGIESLLVDISYLVCLIINLLRYQPTQKDQRSKVNWQI